MYDDENGLQTQAQTHPLTMSISTAISWCDATFNPWWGCRRCSPGCKNCFADRLAIKLGHNVWGNAPRRTFGPKHWEEPLAWNARAARADLAPGVLGAGMPRLVFCGSMCDVFEDHPTVAAEREKLWPLIRATPNLIWQLLTKRAKRIAECLPSDWGDGYPNVWLGTSIENNDYVSRARFLIDVPAVVYFVSYEPALGPLDELNLSGIDWIIFGGESGPNFRPIRLAWAQDIRDRCRAAGVPFFFKQSSSIRTEMGIILDGDLIREFPMSKIKPLAVPEPERMLI